MMMMVTVMKIIVLSMVCSVADGCGCFAVVLGDVAHACPPMKTHFEAISV